MTEIKLELISDIYKHLFIEKGLRREISNIYKIFSKANNKYMKNYYLQKKVNSLYILVKTICMAGE